MGVLHTTFVKSVNPGGRLYSCVSDETRYNGEIGKLGDFANGSHEIYNFEKIEAGDVAKKNIIGFVMQPEMMYDNSRKSLLKLANFEIPAGTPFVFVPLEPGDKVEVSKDLIRTGGNATINVGQFAVLPNNGTLTTVGHTSNYNNVPVNGRYFKVLNIKKAHARSARINGMLAADNYDLYTLELRLKQQ